MNPVVLRIVGPTTLVVAALIAVVVGLVIGGGAAPRLTSDPGAIVRWGLPAAKLFVNLAGASMLGPLVLAVFALPSAGKPFTVALDVASAGAATLTITSGVVAFLTFLSSFNPQVNLSAEFGAQLGRFLLDTELGRSWLITAILASVVTVLAFAVRSYGAVLITTVLAVISLIPMATQGHSGELANHDPAVMSLVLHVIAAAIWLGGLILLVVVRPISSPHELDNMLRRYSTVALIAFIGVAVSGYARALTALGRWEGVASPYGLILLTKIGALLVMGVLGATYRRRLLAKASEGRGAFWMIVCVELGFMGIASGAAAALARTAAPADTIALPQNTAAEILTDAPVPIELTLQRWFTAWSPDLLWVLVAGFGIVFYLVGVRRAQRRGYPWPARRTISWIVGMGVLLWTTSGPLAAYDDALISMRFFSFALLSLAIPLLLVFAAPVTLATLVIHPRDDGSRGPREWLLWAAHSPLARFTLRPVVAAALFATSLWVFHYSDLFRWSLYDQLGAEWMISQLLVTGCLFVRSLALNASTTPEGRWRLPSLIALTGVATFFGIVTITRSDLIVAEWFGAMGRTWGPAPLQDQALAGGATLMIAGTLAILTGFSVLHTKRNNRPTDSTPVPGVRKDPHL
ncbi:MAG: cytochrome c oxidase assembly protein [Rhodoglobus sp.]|uniref:cytochrome c oxidase assembly protein n=1 Tax=Microbacterium sp. SY138 TaxID=3149040 RepID=UPI002ABBB4F0|nr:cytochrome c oxidase assembly protein [Rhodoglobus sp.]